MNILAVLFIRIQWAPDIFCFLGKDTGYFSYIYIYSNRFLCDREQKDCCAAVRAAAAMLEMASNTSISTLSAAPALWIIHPDNTGFIIFSGPLRSKSVVIYTERKSEVKIDEGKISRKKEGWHCSDVP